MHGRPVREDLHGPPPCHHPAVGGESVLAVKTGGVDSGGREAVVVVGVDAEDGVVGIQQRRRLVEVPVGKERGTSIKGSRRKRQHGRCDAGGKTGKNVERKLALESVKRILQIMNRKERYQK